MSKCKNYEFTIYIDGTGQTDNYAKDGSKDMFPRANAARDEIIDRYLHHSVPRRPRSNIQPTYLPIHCRCLSGLFRLIFKDCTKL